MAGFKAGSPSVHVNGQPAKRIVCDQRTGRWLHVALSNGLAEAVVSS